MICFLPLNHSFSQTSEISQFYLCSATTNFAHSDKFKFSYFCKFWLNISAFSWVLCIIGPYFLSTIISQLFEVFIGHWLLHPNYSSSIAIKKVTMLSKALEAAISVCCGYICLEFWYLNLIQQLCCLYHFANYEIVYSILSNH